MKSLIPQKLSQFGKGFEPVSPAWTENGTTTDGVLANMEGFISQVLGLITVVGSIFYVVNFLLAAISWITAGGEAGKISTAREKMVQSTIGLVVVVAAYGIIGLIGSIVGLRLLEPADVIRESLLPG